MRTGTLLIAVLLGLALHGRADVLYTLDPDTFDAGGTLGLSPGTSGVTYTLNPSNEVGGYGASTNYAFFTGYAGQLNDQTLLGPAIGITLFASTAYINEGGTLQLCAQLDFNNGTSQLLPLNLLTWSVQSGPLASISSTGVATAAAVYRDTAARAAASYQTFNGTLPLTVRNVLPDNFGSYANDGIDDDWQVQYFGTDNPLAGPLADPDGDGQTNLFEFGAGVVPTNPESRFLFSIASITDQATLKRLTFSPRFTTRSYTMQMSTELMPGTWTTLMTSQQSDLGFTREVIDTAAVEPRKFYRVLITKP